MKQHQVISFVSSLIISGFIIGAIYLVLLLTTFDLAGGETFQQIENQRLGLLFLAILFVIAACFISRQFVRKGKRFTGYGIIVMPVVCLLIFSISYFDNLTHHTQFDNRVWAKSPWKPFNMTATLVKENKLIGMTRQEVKNLLGQGAEAHSDENSDGGSLVYPVQNDWTLIVFFKNEKAVGTKLRRPFLGV